MLKKIFDLDSNENDRREYTVVSYIHGGIPGTSLSYSMNVFNFKIDTVEKWNEMMRQLEEAHPESKNSIVILFMRELQE